MRQTTIFIRSLQIHNYAKRLLPLIFLTTLTFLLGCDEEEDDDIQPALEIGTAEVDITGALNEELNGTARFTHQIIESEPVDGSRLQILIYDEENPNQVISMEVSVRGDYDGVNPGTYIPDVSSVEGPFVNIYYSTANDQDYIATNTGEITIAGINDDAVWGSFSGKLVEIQSSTIDITGEFHAEAD